MLRNTLQQSVATQWEELSITQILQWTHSGFPLSLCSLLREAAYVIDIKELQYLLVPSIVGPMGNFRTRMEGEYCYVEGDRRVKRWYFSSGSSPPGLHGSLLLFSRQLFLRDLQVQVHIPSCQSPFGARNVKSSAVTSCRSLHCHSPHLCHLCK